MPAGLTLRCPTQKRAVAASVSSKCHRRVRAPIAVVPRAHGVEATTPSAPPSEKANAKDVVQDVVAGVSVAALALPQCVAYAALAGCPPISGLTSNAVSAPVAGSLGSSRYLQTGVMSMGALLTGSALLSLGMPGNAAAAAVLCMLVGVTRLALGACKLGNVINKVPPAVMDGFVVACVWIVFSSQMPPLTGTNPPDMHMLGKLAWVLTHPHLWHWGTVAAAAVAAGSLYVGGKIHVLFPGAVIGCMGAIMMTAMGVATGAVVGAIPIGLPTLQMMSLPWDLAPQLITSAIAIAICCFAEGAAISKRFAEQDGETWNANREMLASGVAGVAAGAFGGLTVSGTISRTSFAKAAGARTRLACIVTGVTCLAFLCMPAAASAMAFLPKSCLAALVAMAVFPIMIPTARMIPQKMEMSKVTDAALGWFTVMATFIAAPRLELGLVAGLGMYGIVWAIRKFALKSDGSDAAVETKEVAEEKPKAEAQASS